MTETVTTSNNTTAAESTMSTRALDAITVIEAASMFGLPMPFNVAITTDAVRAVVWAYDELAIWAERMGADIERGGSVSSGGVHYWTTGTIAGAEVTIDVIAPDGSDR